MSRRHGAGDEKLERLGAFARSLDKDRLPRDYLIRLYVSDAQLADLERLTEAFGISSVDELLRTFVADLVAPERHDPEYAGYEAGTWLRRRWKALTAARLREDSDRALGEARALRLGDGRQRQAAVLGAFGDALPPPADGNRLDRVHCNRRERHCSPEALCGCNCDGCRIARLAGSTRSEP